MTLNFDYHDIKWSNNEVYALFSGRSREELNRMFEAGKRMAQCCVVNGRRAAFFVFRYPHDEYEVFGDILSRMEKSFEVF